jgi:DNA-binding MarR family transcriptional regulator
MDLDQLAGALNAFAALDPTGFPLHHAQLFVEVARRGHCTYAELGEALNLTNGSVSRSVAAMSDTNRYGGMGHCLLETYKDPVQPRRYQVRLSAKGKALLRQIEGP